MTNSQYEPAANGGGVDDEIDIGELLDILLEGKWLVIASTVVVLLFGVAFAFLSTPIYEADALVQLETESDSFGALFGEMGDMLSTSSESTAEIELIKSRLVLGRTIDQMALDVSVEPKYFPLIGKGVARLAGEGNGLAKALTHLFPSKFARSAEGLRLGRFDVPDFLLNVPFSLQITSKDGHYRLTADDLNIELLGKAGDTVRDADSGISIQVQNLQGHLGQVFIVTRKDRLTAVQDLLVELSVSEKGKDSGILSLKLQSASPKDATEILNTIANNYLRQNVERKGEEAEQTLSYLNKELPALRRRLEASEVQFNAYRTSQGSADLMQETELLLRQSSELEAMRLSLSQQREQLLQRFQVTHPSVQAIDAQLRELEGNRKNLEGKIKELPETQQELLRLTRDVKVNTELYTGLLNNAQQLEVAKAGTIGTVRIVDYAGLPREAIKPKKALILAISLVLGGFIGVAAVFLRRALYHTIDDPHVFEQQFGLPVFANVPLSKVQQSLFGKGEKLARGLKTLDRQSTRDDPALEALKSLRTALHFGTHDAANNIVLITGPRPGLGKSFVSTNLAASIASAGRKVIVIDADMRRGSLHRYTGRPRKPGLSEVLTGEMVWREAMGQSEQDGLHVITSGTIPPNPSELLSTPRMVELLKELSAEYDTVIVDSPPNLAVTDSGILAPLAGTTLLVLRADQHPPREIMESIKRVRLGGGQIRGVVFNMVRQQARRYGYGRYNYYYAYKQAKS